MRVLPLIASSLVIAAPLAAQLPAAESHRTGTDTVLRRTMYGAPLASARGADTLAPAAPAQDDPILVRLVTGTLGAFVGTFAGAQLGSQVFSQGSCPRPPTFRCGDRAGGYVGAVIGGAVGAALPKGFSSCSFSKRLGMALFGASTGGLVGYLVGGRGYAVFLSLPIRATAGAIVGAEQPCRTKPRHGSSGESRGPVSDTRSATALMPAVYRHDIPRSPR